MTERRHSFSGPQEPDLDCGDAAVRRVRPGRRRVRLLALATILATILAAAVASGCALPPPNLLAPEIRISDLSLDSLGFETTWFDVVIDARNPNADDITLTDVAVDLTFLDIRLGAGTLPTDRILLAGERTTRIPVTFSMPTSRLLELGARLRDGAPITPLCSASKRPL